MKKVDYNDDNNEDDKRPYFDSGFFVNANDPNRYDEDE
jgi:hypothetical protein